MYTASEIANVLSIPVSDILKESEVPSFLFSSKSDVETKHQQDVMEFTYNYYTLPSPKGYVALFQ